MGVEQGGNLLARALKGTRRNKSPLRLALADNFQRAAKKQWTAMTLGFVPGVGMGTAVAAAFRDALDHQTIWRGPRVEVVEAESGPD